MFLAANTPPEIEDPSIVETNKEPARASFFNFESKKLAKINEPSASGRYLSLNGMWKFNWVRDPLDRPMDSYQTDFDYIIFF